VRLGIDRNERDGYVKSRSGVGPRDFNDINYFAARLSVLAELTPDLQNYTIFSYTKGDTHGTLGKFAFCNPGTKPGSIGIGGQNRAENCALGVRQANYGYWEADNTNADPFVKTRIWQVINTTTWQASDALTVKNIVSYGESKESYSLALMGDFVPFPLVTAKPGALGPQGHQSTFTEELQFQGTSGDLIWQAGGYAEVSNPLGQQEQYTETFVNCADVYAFRCTPKTIDIPGRGPTPIGAVSILRHNYAYRNYGLYAQGTYAITDQLALTGGFRYTWDKTRATGDNIRVVAFPTGPVAFSCSNKVTTASGAGLLTNGACFASFTEKSGKPTWLINLDYKPTPDILVYAKYARGYRAGGANPSNTGYEIWSPEGVDNYEIGVKTTIRGSSVRGTFNIAGFWNDFTNQQVPISLSACVAGTAGCTNPAAAGVQAIQNIGTSCSRASFPAAMRRASPAPMRISSRPGNGCSSHPSTG
jgi:iron complex outermembrane recepter protein